MGSHSTKKASNQTKGLLKNLKSGFILRKLFGNLERKKLLDLIKYNKTLKKRINININDYKEYPLIEIEIIPKMNEFGKFINIKKGDEKYYHIYFNDNKVEIKSNYILRKIFNNLQKEKKLNILKYNKHIKKRINIDINNYKEYSEIYSSIEIEIKSVNKKYGKFINIKEEDEKYYHIYFNDNNQKEIKRTRLNENDKVSKITIIIDYQIKSFEALFYSCDCIESVSFNKFYRNNINNMAEMFSHCSKLKKINFQHFNSNNVTDMSYMFN